MFQRGKTADHDAGEILVKLDFQSKGAYIRRMKWLFRSGSLSEKKFHGPWE